MPEHDREVRAGHQRRGRCDPRRRHRPRLAVRRLPGLRLRPGFQGEVAGRQAAVGAARGHDPHRRVLRGAEDQPGAGRQDRRPYPGRRRGVSPLAGDPTAVRVPPVRRSAVDRY
ncbi:hypothetical protein SGPA1_11705 [Streptomyces misionensis JCM 4497]